jgi:hypothetical protein
LECGSPERYVVSTLLCLSGVLVLASFLSEIVWR